MKDILKKKKARKKRVQMMHDHDNYAEIMERFRAICKKCDDEKTIMDAYKKSRKTLFKASADKPYLNRIRGEYLDEMDELITKRINVLRREKRLEDMYGKNNG